MPDHQNDADDLERYVKWLSLRKKIAMSLPCDERAVFDWAMDRSDRRSRQLTKMIYGKDEEVKGGASCSAP